MTPVPDPSRETVTIAEAASRAQVTRRTIYNWLAAGKLDSIRTAGGMVRIYADSLWRDGEKGAGDGHAH